MNTEADDTATASPGSPHLDLEDLLAGVNGEQVSDQAREHLAACEHCQAEALRWDTVAGGVRGLMAATPEAAPLSPPRHGRVGAFTGRKPRTMLAASAAAALVLIGGASYGLTAAFTGSSASPAGTGPGTAALTAVGGCTELKAASGTLEQVSGTSLLIKTANGQQVSVTTATATNVTVGLAPLSDITDGASVVVGGRESGGTLAARTVGIGPLPSKGRVVTPFGLIVTQGTVADASTGGFTVVTSDGTRVGVTTSNETNVSLLHASLSQLHAGVRTIAIGRIGPDGTLAATEVLQPGLRGAKWEVKGCSPGSIRTAITTALIAG